VLRTTRYLKTKLECLTTCSFALKTFTILASLGPSCKNAFVHKKLAKAVRPFCPMYWIAGTGSYSRTASACAQFSCPFLNLQRKQTCFDHVQSPCGMFLSHVETRWPFTSIMSHSFTSSASVAASTSCSSCSCRASLGCRIFEKLKSCSNDGASFMPVRACNDVIVHAVSANMVGRGVWQRQTSIGGLFWVTGLGQQCISDGNVCVCLNPLKKGNLHHR